MGELARPAGRIRTPRSSGHLPNPYDDCCDCDDGEVVSCGFLEARCDPAELLELGEAVFDQVALGIFGRLELRRPR